MEIKQKLMNNKKIDYIGERRTEIAMRVVDKMCALLLIKFLGQWFGGGQEAIPYKNSRVITYLPLVGDSLIKLSLIGSYVHRLMLLCIFISWFTVPISLSYKLHDRVFHHVNILA